MTTLFLAAADESGGFVAPGPAEFVFPPIVGDFTKPMALFILSALLIIGFFYATTRRMQLVPSKLQFAGESLYGFVRDGVARESIGPTFRTYVPFLVTLFTFVLVNNIFGIVPLIQFPTFSRVGMAYALAIVVWILFITVGIRKKGVLRYFKDVVWPPDVPAAVRPLLIVIEFLSTIIARPVTLSLRLFGNMFAGHLLLLLFVLGGEYLLFSGSLGLALVSPFAFLFAILFTFFEALVQVLQAYIFVLLTAIYIGGALAEEH